MVQELCKTKFNHKVRIISMLTYNHDCECYCEPLYVYSYCERYQFLCILYVLYSDIKRFRCQRSVLQGCIALVGDRYKINNKIDRALNLWHNNVEFYMCTSYCMYSISNIAASAFGVNKNSIL